jgi:hypothetical protein
MQSLQTLKLREAIRSANFEPIVPSYKQFNDWDLQNQS